MTNFCSKGIQNIIHINKTAWVNFTNFKKIPQFSTIVTMTPKQFSKGSGSQYETDLVWQSPYFEMVYALKAFLHGKSILLIRKKYKDLDAAKTNEFCVHFTVMNLRFTRKPGHVKNRGIIFSSGEANSGKRFIHNIYDAKVTGKHGNMVVMFHSIHKKLLVLLLVFSRNGAKLLAKSRQEADPPIEERFHYHYELACSPESRFVYLMGNKGDLFAYEILHERSIVLRAKYSFEHKMMRPKGLMVGQLSHIFCYSEKRVILLMNFGDKYDLKFMVFTYKEDKQGLVKSKVKNGDGFGFRGDVTFYRRNGRIYFCNLKESVYRLTL